MKKLLLFFIQVFATVVASLILFLISVMVIGKTSSELRDEGITKAERNITIRRIDHFKEHVVLPLFKSSAQEDKITG